MSEDQSGKPLIRFKGFDDGWRHHVFGELFDENREKNETKYGVERTISISSMSFNPTGNGADKSSLTKYKVLRIGDIAFEGHTSKAFAYGRFVMNDIGNGIMSPRFTTLRPKFKLTVDFWKHYIHYEPIMRAKLIRSTKAGTMMNELVIEDLLTDSLLVPTEKEQNRIGALLTQFNQLIALYQYEHSRIINFKKAMMEKMFPKNGSDRPEIRFKGFDEAWEQHKFGELSKKTYGGGTPNTSTPEFWNGTIPWIQSSNLSDENFSANVCKHISDAGVKNSAAQIIPSNSIAIVTHVGVGKLSIVPFEYCSSQDFISLSELSGDPYFLAIAFQKKLKNDIRIVQGSAIKGITKDDLLNKSIFTPRYEEQKIIGKFFSEIDDLISSHQHELEKLQNMKKSLMGRMFVQER